jgi:hypothetical protein
MHGQARDFTIFVKQILGNYFIDKRVLDVGSGDINGNNRFLFENCEYDGNDVIQAHNVTIVSKTKDLPFTDNTFVPLYLPNVLSMTQNIKSHLLKFIIC